MAEKYCLWFAELVLFLEGTIYMSSWLSVKLKRIQVNSGSALHLTPQNTPGWPFLKTPTCSVSNEYSASTGYRNKWTNLFTNLVVQHSENSLLSGPWSGPGCPQRPWERMQCECWSPEEGNTNAWLQPQYKYSKLHVVKYVIFTKSSNTPYSLGQGF